MLEDPAILANILLVLFIGLVLVIAWLVLSTIARWIVSGVSRDDEPEPDTYGDDGGRPPAPEIGSGLLAGDMEPGDWPAYGLKRLDGHKRGRVEVTGEGRVWPDPSTTLTNWEAGD